jgi:hypothetical protein
MRTLPTSVSLLAPAALALVLGCQDKGAPAQPAAPAAAAPEPSLGKSAFHAHMQEHFVKADDVEKFIVSGQVELAKQAAAWIGSHEPPPGLEAKYAEHVARMQDAARRIGVAPDAASAAEAAAQMAAACAGCHAAHDKVLDFGTDPVPAAGEGLEAHKARHGWGATRMWDGLVGGKDALWQSGLDALEDLPASSKALVTRPELATGVEHLSGRVQAMLTLGKAAATPSAKAEVLSGVLAACGTCHAMSKAPPAAE